MERGNVEKKSMEFDPFETGLVALAVRMQIDTLEEGIEAIMYAPCYNKADLMQMRSMLVSYKKIYKKFDQYVELVDDYMKKS